MLAFRRDALGAGQWGEVAKLQPSTPREDAYLGFAVTLEGERLLAGAPDDFYEPGAGPGSAHEFDLARLARSTWRNDALGRNLDAHTSESLPIVGTTYRARVDLLGAHRDHALLLVYLHPDELTLAGGQVRLGRDLFARIGATSPGLFEAAIPASPGLIGRSVVTQAALHGGQPGFELSNALDLVLGVD